MTGFFWKLEKIKITGDTRLFQCVGTAWWVPTLCPSSLAHPTCHGAVFGAQSSRAASSYLKNSPSMPLNLSQVSKLDPRSPRSRQANKAHILPKRSHALAGAPLPCAVSRNLSPNPPLPRQVLLKGDRSSQMMCYRRGAVRYTCGILLSQEVGDFPLKNKFRTFPWN